ncbi:MAG TPA: TatD family hydrolase [Polyangiaceae bacterium LLY-WYZ-14_1]|nr:TatD family hydrolase [Polyangiaceae bacterium LLY-WYZ-14_1]
MTTDAALPPAPLVDTHCHLDFDSFEGDFDAVLDRAWTAGVRRIVTIGSGDGLDSAERAMEVAAAHGAWVHPTVGVHPHDARLLDDAAYARIATLAEREEVVAIGETGLDFHYDHSPREAQRQAFRRQIALARQVRKPIVVHTRSAPEETLSILREEDARDVGGIIHCFSEDAPFAKAALDLGFVSSFSGIVTFKRATEIQEAARTQPADAILVETDAPFLAPVPYRGKRNEPAWVAKTADFVAELRGEAPEAFRERTSANALRVFRLPPLPEAAGSSAPPPPGRP